MVDNSAGSLGINNHSEVCVDCKPVAAQWRDLGSRLGVLQPTLAVIESDHRGDAVRCLSAAIEKWLTRPRGEVRDSSVVPTWRSLCEALSYINESLAEAIAVEHGCGYISTAVSKVASQHGAVPPAFLPQSCGCGQCTVKGWMTGRVCQNVYHDKMPKLLVVNPGNPLVDELIEFRDSYDRQARLFIETSELIDFFHSVSLETWSHFEDFSAEKISKMILKLNVLFKRSFPSISNINDFQNQVHLLNISWFNFRPLHFLAEQFLSSHSDLLTSWDNYKVIFSEYCFTRSLKSYTNVFFQVKSHNVFLLEVDEHYHNFTLSDITALRDSLSLALGVSSVCLHLVVVSKGSLVIYFHYSYSDYLMVLESLTTQQLRDIATIKGYKILSLTDLHNQFRYDNIQSYNDCQASPTSDNGCINKTTMEDESHEMIPSELKAYTEVLKKQSVVKDIELFKNKEEIQLLKEKLAKEMEKTKLAVEEVSKKNVALSRTRDQLLIDQSSLFHLSGIIHGKLVKTINLQYGYCHLAVCDNGDILATEQTTHTVTILDKEERRVKSLGTRGAKEGQFVCPYGVAVSNDGHVLVTDQHRLKKLTFDGVCVKTVGSSQCGRGQLQLSDPRGIAVHSTTGQIFVADEWNKRVQVFNGDLTFSHTITLPDDKQFHKPCDVALDSEGYLYVGEWNYRYITKLTTRGQYISRFGSEGSSGQLQYPSSLAIHNNLVYVSEWDNHRLSIFTTQGTFLHCFGKKGSGEADFNKPWGVAVDRLGNLYVSDYGNKRIVVY